jgi:hypothetical protein
MLVGAGRKQRERGLHPRAPAKAREAFGADGNIKPGTMVRWSAVSGGKQTEEFSSTFYKMWRRLKGLMGQKRTRGTDRINNKTKKTKTNKQRKGNK